MSEKSLSNNFDSAGGKCCYHNGTSRHYTITSPDVIEKDSRNGGINGNVHYPPSMHNVITTRPVFLLARSPVMDNEKDMTRTPTTPKSPPAPITANSPTSTGSSSSHDGKIAPRSVGSGVSMATTDVLSRGAHLPTYCSASLSTFSNTSSSSSMGSGIGGGNVASTSGRRTVAGARPPPSRTQHSYPPPTSAASGGHRFPPYHHGGGCGREGVGGEGRRPHPHLLSDRTYRMSGQYDTRYGNRTTTSSVAGGMYNHPAQAYSTYPSESHVPYRSNYSRPLSTGSLSSITTASSRPGFSSLDEFPAMHDHRSTFAPSAGVMGEASYRPYHYHSGGGDSRYYPPIPYRQFHDHLSSTTASYAVGLSSLLSPSSCDEHQPLLSLSLHEHHHHLQKQHSSNSSSAMLLGESSSDELGGQVISEELSAKLNIDNPNTRHTLEPEVAGKDTTITGVDETNDIMILEHPKDVDVLLNERAVLRCTAQITGRGQEQSQSKGLQEEKEEEPNLLWYKDAEPLIGEIDSEFVVENVTERDMGVYYCLVSHPTLEHIQRQSNVATLTIKKGGGAGEPDRTETSAPEMVEQPPKEIAAVIDEELLIPIKATGVQLCFRWYKDNKELRYAEGPVLRIPSARYSDSGIYCCSISNKFGSVLSNNSLVRVTQVRDYSAQPQPGGFRRPTSLYDWGDQPLSDGFLRDVGKAVAHQTTNLDRIALYLGLRNQDIVEINKHFRNPDDQAFHMLRLWSQRQGRERSMLKIILTKAGIKLDLLAAGTSRNKQTVKPPKIAVHPKSTQVIYGHRLNLDVQVDPCEPAFSLQYQWYRNNKPLGGKTDPHIMISSATNGDAGEYYCIVSNQSEKTVSKAAKVEVINPHGPSPLPPPPTSSCLRPTMPASTAKPTFLKGQWESHHDDGGEAPPTAGGDFLSRGDLREGDDQLSRQPLTGTGGGTLVGQIRDSETTGRAGTVLLNQHQVSSPQYHKPQIVEHPQSQQVEAGDPLTLRCSAVGVIGQLSYTWYFNGLSLAGENRPKYEINCFTDEDEGLYQCKVQSAHGEVFSRMAHIQMKEDASD